MKNMIKKMISAMLALAMMTEMSLIAFAGNIPVIDMGTFHNIYTKGGETGGGSTGGGSGTGTETGTGEGFNLDDWEYETASWDDYGDVINLEKYKGKAKEIAIKGKVKKDGKDYKVLLGISYDPETRENHSLFEDDHSIEKVTFESVDGTPVGCTSMNGADSLFKGCTALKKVEFNNSLTAIGDYKLKSISSMFEGCTSLEAADLTNLDLSSCEDTRKAFKDCTGIKKLILNGADFSETWHMEEMFKGCSSLKEADLTTATWGDLSKLAEGMFDDDSLLTEITVPYDFNPSACGVGLFKTDKLTKMTIKGDPSDAVLYDVIPCFKENNRYLGEISVKASVESEGEELKDGEYRFTLYDGEPSEGQALATAKNDKEGNINFGSIKIYKISLPLKYTAVMNGEGSKAENLEKTFRLGLNSDGSLIEKEAEEIW